MAAISEQFVVPLVGWVNATERQLMMLLPTCTQLCHVHCKYIHVQVHVQVQVQVHVLASCLKCTHTNTQLVISTEHDKDRACLGLPYIKCFGLTIYFSFLYNLFQID